MVLDAPHRSLFALPFASGQEQAQAHRWDICLQPLLDCVTGSSGGEIPSTWQPASCRRRVNCCGTIAAFNIHQQTPFQLRGVGGWVRHWKAGETGEGYRGRRDVGNIWFPLTSWANNLQNKKTPAKPPWIVGELVYANERAATKSASLKVTLWFWFVNEWGPWDDIIVQLP